MFFFLDCESSQWISFQLVYLGIFLEHIDLEDLASYFLDFLVISIFHNFCHILCTFVQDEIKIGDVQDEILLKRRVWKHEVSASSRQATIFVQKTSSVCLYSVTISIGREFELF